MEELETVGLQAFSLRSFLLFRRPTKKGFQSLDRPSIPEARHG
jgi:hypothetical protein